MGQVYKHNEVLMISFPDGAHFIVAAGACTLISKRQLDGSIQQVYLYVLAFYVISYPCPVLINKLQLSLS